MSTTSGRFGRTRRDFLQSAVLASGAALALPARAARGLAKAPKPFKLGVFTKPLQEHTFDETAEIVASVGWDGIECPVRRGGQVLPERVEDDLPRLAAALKKHQLEIFTIATDIKDASDPLNERVLQTAAKLGIKTYRLASLRYDLSQPIQPQVEAFRAGFRELEAINRSLGIGAAYENHSGRDNFGAPVWDILSAFRDTDPESFGVCLDVGHAMVEGGLDWEVQFHAAEPLLRAVYVKDFVWRKSEAGWDAVWCPLGDGMLNPKVADVLMKSPFRGPLIQHFEYPLGVGKLMHGALRRDLETLQKWIAAAAAPAKAAKGATKAP